MESELIQPKLLASARKILKEAWIIYRANVVKFIYLAIVPFVFLLPVIFWSRIADKDWGKTGYYFLGQSPSLVLSNFPDLAFGLLGAAFVAFGIVAQLLFSLSLIFVIKERQSGISVKKALRFAWGKLASYVWVWFLAAILISFGFLLFIIPGIVFSIWFALAIYILVAEDKRGRKALARSKELVRGYWWKVFWRLIVIGIVVIIFSLPFSFLADYAQRTNLIWPEIIAGTLSLIVSLLLQGLTACYGFLLYENLRKIKETNNLSRKEVRINDSANLG